MIWFYNKTSTTRRLGGIRRTASIARGGLCAVTLRAEMQNVPVHGQQQIEAPFQRPARSFLSGVLQYAGLEPRLILSKDFAKLNFTLNVAEELPVNRGTPSLEVASGTRYDATELFRFGSELKYDVHERSGAIIPQICLALPHESTFKAVYSKGFDCNHEDFMRLAVEVEF